MGGNGGREMWLILQSLIVFAVVASNIRWQWTPNVYLASALGFLLALLVTVGLSRLIELARRVRNGR
jgi:hypothetical protein